jgi:ribosome maturation protein Sdo1
MEEQIQTVIRTIDNPFYININNNKLCIKLAREYNLTSKGWAAWFGEIQIALRNRIYKMKRFGR